MLRILYGRVLPGRSELRHHLLSINGQYGGDKLGCYSRGALHFHHGCWRRGNDSRAKPGVMREWVVLLRGGCRRWLLSVGICVWNQLHSDGKWAAEYGKGGAQSGERCPLDLGVCGGWCDECCWDGLAVG